MSSVTWAMLVCRCQWQRAGRNQSIWRGHLLNTRYVFVSLPIISHVCSLFNCNYICFILQVITGIRIKINVFRCFRFVVGKTVCQKEKEEVLEAGAVVQRTCDKTGRFDLVQCDSPTNPEYCWCVDRYGKEIPRSRLRGPKRPRCDSKSKICNYTLRLYPRGIGSSVKTPRVDCREIGKIIKKNNISPLCFNLCSV